MHRFLDVEVLLLTGIYLVKWMHLLTAITEVRSVRRKYFFPAELGTSEVDHILISHVFEKNHHDFVIPLGCRTGWLGGTRVPLDFDDGIFGGDIYLSQGS